MEVKKQQLELDMERQTGSKLGKEYVKAVHCHPAYLTYMQSTSCEMPGWMTHKLDSRLPWVFIFCVRSLFRGGIPHRALLVVGRCRFLYSRPYTFIIQSYSSSEESYSEETCSVQNFLNVCSHDIPFQVLPNKYL